MLVVTGTVGFDHILNYPGRFAEAILPEQIHKLNISFDVDTFQKEFGGTATNQAYSLGLLGQHPVLITTVGNDFAPIGDYLTKAGVNIGKLKHIKDKPSAVGFVTTDLDDNQIWGYGAGATADTSGYSLVDWLDTQEKPENIFVLLAPQNLKALLKWAGECKKAGYRYMFDPAFYLPQMNKQQLQPAIKGAELTFCNDYEAQLILDKLNAKKISELFTDPRQKAIVVTLGPKGSIIYATKSNKVTEIKIKAAKLKKVIDPTGAGDAYRSGFITGYLNGQSLKVAGRMGAVAAAYAIEHYGTIKHSYTITQFKRRYQQNFKDVLELHI